MARELIVNIKCDLCGKPVEEEHVKSGEFVFGGRTFAVDLCPDDFDDLTSKLQPKAAALTQAKQQQIQYPSNKKGKVMPCPACGHLVKNDLGLKFHIKRMHPGSDYQTIARN